MALWVLLEHKDPSPYLSHLDKTDGILQFLRKKKVDLRLISHTEDINRITKDKDAVLLFPSDLLPEHTETIKFCNRNHIPVFVLDSSNQLPGCHYSSVGGDPLSAVSTIVSYLCQHNRTKMAYFGSGTKTTDIAKISEFYSLMKDFNEDDIYFRYDSHEKCFERFFARRDEYDAIICANDMVAIFLIEKLKETDPEYINKVFIISYMNSVLSQVYHTPITSASYDVEYTHPAILTMYRSLAKSREYAQTFSMTLKTIVYPRATTGYLPYDSNETSFLPERTGKMYIAPLAESSDYHATVISEILSIEGLLRYSIKADLILILLFLQGKNQEEVAQKLFIAIQTVRYRSGIIFKKVGVKNKKAFVTLLSKYVSTENLEKYIQSKNR